MGLYEEMLKRLSRKINDEKIPRKELSTYLTNFRFKKTDVRYLEKDLIAMQSIYRNKKSIKIRKFYK